MSPSVGPVLGQDRVLRFLGHAVSSGRLPHGLLFLGPRGVGRETTALALAAGLVCEQAGAHPRPAPYGCGTCSACRRVASGNHPDVHLVLTEAEAVSRGLEGPDGGRRPSLQIRIDQIRELARVMRMKPYEGRAKVAIVVDAHRMNDNAANALLKTLEEPGPRSCLVLIAPHERSLLPTVSSRCGRLRFNPLPVDALESILTREGFADAGARAARADGSLHVARGLHAQESAEAVEELLEGLLAPRSTDRLQAIEEIGRDRQDLEDLLLRVERLAGQRLRATAEGRSDEPTRPWLKLLEAMRDTRDGMEVNGHVQIALEELFLMRAE